MNKHSWPALPCGLEPDKVWVESHIEKDSIPDVLFDPREGLRFWMNSDNHGPSGVPRGTKTPDGYSY
jgi:hypothetical protein